MNLAQSIITIIVLMAATMVTRFLPFLIFTFFVRDSNFCSFFFYIISCLDFYGF